MSNKKIRNVNSKDIKKDPAELPEKTSENETYDDSKATDVAEIDALVAILENEAKQCELDIERKKNAFSDKTKKKNKAINNINVNNENISLPEQSESLDCEKSDADCSKAGSLKINSNIIQRLVFGGTAFVLVAGLVFVRVYSSDANKYKRYINKGDKLYSEERYDDCTEVYSKALNLEVDNENAFLGLIRSNIRSNSAEARLYYEKAVDELKRSQRSDGLRDIDIELLLFAEQIYDKEEASEYYASFYKNWNDERLFNAFSELKTGYAKQLIEERDYVLAARNLIDVVTLDGAKAEKAKELLKECVIPYADYLISVKRLADCEAFLDDYASFAPKEDLIRLETRLKEAKSIYAIKSRLLSKVYDSLEPLFTSLEEDEDVILDSVDSFLNNKGFAYEFEPIMKLDGSKEANELIGAVMGRSYVYSKEFENDDFTGVGAGIYSYGDYWNDDSLMIHAAYYFYVGEYVDGIRNGKGIAFTKTGEDSFELFFGKYKDGFPEGTGIKYVCKSDKKTIIKGEYHEGIASGLMKVADMSMEYPDKLFVGEISVNQGIPSACIPNGDGYSVDTSLIPDGYILISVMPEINEGYDLFVTKIWNSEKRIGAVGFE